ncbi:MAG: aspartate carbamoyltransferase catalytic subunit, partial [Candidatus Thioglobus sp.]
MLKKKTVVELGNLLTIESLTCDTIHNLIDSAESFAHTPANSVHSLLSNKVIANLFFEPSTRTQYSFEIAAKNLGANIISPAIYNLSTLKGESLLDTIHTFEAMGVALFIVRHNVNHTPEFLSSELNGDAKILNAGDGTHQHPSQCLIDLMTIKQHTKNFDSI